MVKLLVSVRNHREAWTAMSAGADIIDVKEPARGSLGAADANTVRAVAARVQERLPVSMACGELSQLKANRHTEPLPVRYAKIGMSHYRGATWRRDWSQWCQSLAKGTHPIAVAYADTALAKSPALPDIIAFAPRVGCSGILIDTFSKRQARSLLDYSNPGEIVKMIRLAHENSLFVALAGSLDDKSIPSVLKWHPDIIAVRGAVCDGHRLGCVDGQKVRRLVGLLARHAVQDQPG